MVTSPKLLVIDKSVFHTFYDCDEKLCELVKKYYVVLPHTLTIECVISERRLDKDPDKLFRILDKSIKAGAILGYESPELLKAEQLTLCPVKSIVDEANTQQFRNFTPEINEDTIKQAANHCIEVSKQKINSLLGYAQTMYENICKNQTFLKSFNKPRGIEERFQKWIQYVDQICMNNAVEIGFGKHIGSQVDADWYTWQFTRLWWVYCWEWSYKKSLPGSCEKKDISNDFYDIEPVLYLLRADGLLTNDTKLEIPLAKAAFPEKEVFDVNTTLNASRTVQDVYDDIIKKIPNSYSFDQQN